MVRGPDQNEIQVGYLESNLGIKGYFATQIERGGIVKAARGGDSDSSINKLGNDLFEVSVPGFGNYGESKFYVSESLDILAQSIVEQLKEEPHSQMKVVDIEIPGLYVGQDNKPTPGVIGGSSRKGPRPFFTISKIEPEQIQVLAYKVTQAYS